MPLTFEVVFVDKIVGNDRRTYVEWESLSSFPNLNEIVKRAVVKVCKFLRCKPSELVFRSVKLV